MANKDSILYLPRNIDLITNTALTQGHVWLKPNIIKPIKSQCKSDIDIIWYDKEQYFAQSISFKDAEKIANAVGGVLRDKFNNIFIKKTNFENLEMNTVKIMGILNVTPDSFYDGGNYDDENKALDHAKKMSAHGADIIDVGGESTKTNAEYVSEKEEANRVLKVIKALSKKGYLVSADTRKHLVMEKAIDSGAKIINDIPLPIPL